MSFNTLFMWQIVELLSSCGVQFEKSKRKEHSIAVFISVPEHSYKVNADQEEMAGERLAEYAQETLLDSLGLSSGDIEISYRIRGGETWTVQQRNNELSKNLPGDDSKK